MKDKYTHGTIPGRQGRYRVNNKNNDCEFVLWDAGEHGHKKPFWHRMGDGWIDKFVKGYPTEQQKAERLEF